MRIPLGTHPTQQVQLAENGKAPTRFLLFKEGPMPWDGDVLDAELAERLVSSFDEHGTKIPIDYHHASELVDPAQGGKAIAAGHIGKLVYVKGDGLYAEQVEWTDQGRKDVESKAFIYTSPAVFGNKDHSIARISSVALTNKPRTVDAEELLKVAEMLNVSAKTRKGTIMKQAERKLLAEGLETVIRVKLAAEHDIGGVDGDGPAVDAGQKALSDLIEVLKSKGAAIESDASMVTVITAAVEMLGGEPEDETEGTEETVEDATVAETKGTKTAESGSAADQVKLAQFDTLNSQVKALTSKLAERDAADKAARVEVMIAEQVKANKLNPNSEEHMASARKLAASDPKSFDALFADISPYAPTTASTPSGKTGSGTGGTRKRLIADARTEYDSGGESMKIVCPKLASFVNGTLRDNNQTLLTEDERKSLV